MGDALLDALTNLASGTHLLYLLGGVGLGLVIGVLPGLGGITGMSLLLPFLYGMDPVDALALLIGLIAVIPTSDTFTSVLMGIPGSSGSQATVLDGFPLARQGEGARALGAAFAASLFGGVFGAVLLTLFILVARPIVLAFGSAELFMLTVLGLSMVGVLAGASLAKGLAACGLGLLLGAMGGAPATGEFRMTLGIAYLSDGVPLVVVGLALFAIPEIVDLLRSGLTISRSASLGRGWLDGLRDTIQHRWIVLRCATLGCLVGALPGLGGTVVDWIAYGHVVQTSRDRERFGKGDIRGVLAPESANNAKEGGGLVPTLLFGVPGSGSMAIFLGGMVLLGIEPGGRMVQHNLHLTYTIIWSLALANVFGAGACLLLARPVASLTTIPYAYLAPFMLMVVCFASYQATRHWGDILALFVLGAFGVYMKRFGWARPAFLIGYVLSVSAETYLYQAIQFYGWGWLGRPGVLVITTVAAVSVYLGVRYSPAGRAAAPERAAPRRWPQVAFAVLIAAVFVFGIVDAWDRRLLGRVFPLSIAVVMLAFALYALVRITAGRPGDVLVFDAEAGGAAGPSAEHYLAWLGAFLVAGYLVGFVPAVALFFVAFLEVKARATALVNAVLTAGAVAFLAIMGRLLAVHYPPGLLQDLVDLPWPLG